MSADDLALARRFYAEDVCFPLDNRRLIDAFTTVPREAFVGWTLANSEPSHRAALSAHEGREPTPPLS